MTAQATPDAPRQMDPEAAQAMLQRAGIATPVQGVAADARAAARLAERLGYPVALKAIAPSASHKSDSGGVRLGLADGDAVRESATTMRATIPDLEGFLVQAMAPAGLELIAGIRRDPTFGPAVMVGLGGIWAEALDDVAVRLAPLSLAEGHAMLAELRGARVLDGFRGGPAVDRTELATTLMALGEMALADPSLLELDLNPLLATPGGVLALDVRVICGPSAPAPAARRPRAADVARLLNPRSVAVVGASSQPDKQGARVLRYLLEHGYEGRTFVVNPNPEPVQGHPPYARLADLPEVPDVACVVVPAAAVEGVIADCATAGIGGAIVFSSGFAETGPQGAALQHALGADQRVSICGPNTAGVMCAGSKFAAASVRSFESAAVPGGEIALVSQSGAVASSLLGRAWAEGTGLSHWICSGNEADLTVADYIAYLATDPAARIIALFLETVRDGPGFVAACRAARAAGKPVLVYKAGTSRDGARAVGSHTGALAGDDRVYDAAFTAAGAVRVRDIQGLMDAAVAAAWQPLPAGTGLGVVSTSGGMCGVVADEAEAAGLALPAFNPELTGRVAGLIPAYGSSQNPVDVTMDFASRPAMIGDVLELMLDDDRVDTGLVVLTTNADPSAGAVAERVVDVAARSTKPVLVTRMGPEHLAPAALARYREARIPVFPMPERTVAVARVMHRLGMVGG